MKKRMIQIILVFIVSSLVACSQSHNAKTENIPKVIDDVDINIEPVITKKADTTVIESIQTEPTVSTKPTVSEIPKIVLEDYSELFVDRNGCVVIYDTDKDEYHIYNEAMINTQVSPYSTFKIVATLMGLKSHILEDENSTMNYNQTKYSNESWNHELTLYEAFQASCVWYFRQVIDGVGYNEVEKELTELEYGNHDISEWNGAESDSPAELKGFWLGSSLNISPMEQVQVLQKIFQEDSPYSMEQIDLLKEIMLTDEINGYQILGKTGTGWSEGWYVGIAEKDSTEYYFAVYLNEEKGNKKASGATARTILINIFCDLKLR